MSPKPRKPWAAFRVAAMACGIVCVAATQCDRQTPAAAPKTEKAAVPPAENAVPADPAPEPPQTPAPGTAVAETPPAKPQISEDLINDEHFREEYGVNETTTPSIEKIFATLNDLGPLKYDQLKRSISRSTPVDRVLISMGLGALIADGFLIVHCEKTEVMHDIGSALLGYAGALSAGDRIRKHSQSLMDQSLTKRWDQLRKELAATQRDVEAEMVLLQDRDFAHLVSIGGWVRAFEIATRSVAGNYSEETSRHLTRNQIAKYYIQGLGELKPELQDDVTIKAVRKGLDELLPLIDGIEGKALTVEQVKVLSEKAAELARIVTKV